MGRGHHLRLRHGGPEPRVQVDPGFARQGADAVDRRVRRGRRARGRRGGAVGAVVAERTSFGLQYRSRVRARSRDARGCLSVAVLGGRAMLLKGCLRVTLFVACSTALAAGCGGLRKFPLTGNDGGTTGIGGGGGRSPAATAARVAASPSMAERRRRVHRRRQPRRSGQQLRRGRRVCSRQPVPQGDVRLQGRRDVVHGADRRAGERDDVRTGHGLSQRQLRRLRRRHGLQRQQQALPRR